MNGKLIVRLVEAALAGKIEQVKLIANLISSEIRSVDVESSRQITKLVSAQLRFAQERVNPHAIKSVEPGNFTLNNVKNDSLEELVLSKENKNKIDKVINERNNTTKLQAHGLEPTKTMMFVGPPGVGKTLTAKWLAKEMGLPLKIMDLASIMSSFLGKTGSNVRSIFDEASLYPCVLLLDEFDAIAKKRDDDNDVGELKRLVTVILQSIDAWPSSSILIAATNHSELLDPAIWRRFETKLAFSYPNDSELKNFLFKLTGNKGISDLYPLFRGASYSDIKNELMKSKRQSILDGKDIFQHVISGLVESGVYEDMSMEDKKSLVPYLMSASMSQRKISEVLSISRPTIKKILCK